MTDRELLEKAAKAAGYTITEWCQSPLLGCYVEEGYSRGFRWSPLHDDGDALRLAVKLDIDFRRGRSGRGSIATARGARFDEPDGGDPYAATRRAIVRAAAEMVGI